MIGDRTCRGCPRVRENSSMIVSFDTIKDSIRFGVVIRMDQFGDLEMNGRTVKDNKKIVSMLTSMRS